MFIDFHIKHFFLPPIKNFGTGNHTVLYHIRHSPFMSFMYFLVDSESIYTHAHSFE